MWSLFKQQSSETGMIENEQLTLKQQEEEQRRIQSHPPQSQTSQFISQDVSRLPANPNPPLIAQPAQILIHNISPVASSNSSPLAISKASSISAAPVPIPTHNRVEVNEVGNLTPPKRYKQTELNKDSPAPSPSRMSLDSPPVIASKVDVSQVTQISLSPTMPLSSIRNDIAEQSSTPNITNRAVSADVRSVSPHSVTTPQSAPVSPRRKRIPEQEFFPNDAATTDTASFSTSSIILPGVSLNGKNRKLTEQRNKLPDSLKNKSSSGDSS